METLQLLSDDPEARSEHLWPGLRLFADRLAGMIPALPTDSPLLLTGSWGSGKTTLLQAVAARLGSGRTIWFDAWRHTGDRMLLPALVRTIWEQTPEHTRTSALTTAYEEAWHAALQASDPGYPRLGSPPSAAPIRTLCRCLKTLLHHRWPAPPAPVILIDDLDRCLPERAVMLLDQLRALLTSGVLSCRFVVAMDREVLARLIAWKFSALEVYDGNRYLEKLFPLSFDVPLPRRREAAELVAMLLRSSTSPSDLEHRDALTLALSEPFFANPRLMKRCINRYRLVVHFEATGGAPPEIAAELDEASNRSLARWIAATERWPRLRRMLHEHGDAWWRKLGEAVMDRSGVLDPGRLSGPDAAAVLNERGARAWLRREIFSGSPAMLANYRVADLRLRRWGL